MWGKGGGSGKWGAKGSSKSGGKKGKGQGQPAASSAQSWGGAEYGSNWQPQSQWGSGPPQETWGPSEWEAPMGGEAGKGGKGEVRDYVKRLEGRYASGKAMLRPYFNQDGAAVYTPTKCAFEAWTKENLRAVLDQGNSELVRRPAMGISMVSSSLLGLKAVLTQEAAKGTDAENVSGGKNLEAVLDLIMSGKARPFWAACAKLQSMGTTADDKETAAAIRNWIGFLREHKKVLSASLPYVAQFASALYLGASQMLEAVTMANALANWAGKVPATAGNKEALEKWRDDVKNLDALQKFLLHAIDRRRKDEMEWRRREGAGIGGDSDDELPSAGPNREKKRPGESSSSSESSSAKRRKKEQKKKEKEAKKKDKKEKKKKKDKSSSSDEEADKEKKTKKNKEKKDKEKKEKKKKDKSSSSDEAEQPGEEGPETEPAAEAPSPEGAGAAGDAGGDGEE